jgi:hypothetical protein
MIDPKLKQKERQRTEEPSQESTLRGDSLDIGMQSTAVASAPAGVAEDGSIKPER